MSFSPKKKMKKTGKRMKKTGKRLVEDFIIPALNEKRYGEIMKWTDYSKGEFIIKWSHKNSASWKFYDTIVFQDWDKLKNRFKPHEDNYYNDAKQRFRAALYKLTTIIPLTTYTKGYKAFRIAFGAQRQAVKKQKKNNSPTAVRTSVIKRNTQCRLNFSWTNIEEEELKRSEMEYAAACEQQRNFSSNDSGIASLDRSESEECIEESVSSEGSRPISPERASSEGTVTISSTNASSIESAHNDEGQELQSKLVQLLRKKSNTQTLSTNMLMTNCERSSKSPSSRLVRDKHILCYSNQRVSLNEKVPNAIVLQKVHEPNLIFSSSTSGTGSQDRSGSISSEGSIELEEGPSSDESIQSASKNISAAESLQELQKRPINTILKENSNSQLTSCTNVVTLTCPGLVPTSHHGSPAVFLGRSYTTTDFSGFLPTGALNLSTHHNRENMVN